MKRTFDKITAKTAAVLTLTITACVTLLIACAKKPLTDDLRLKKDIVIDGRNVSTMTVADARAALTADAQARLNKQVLTLVLPNGSTPFPANALGAYYDIERALSEAAALRTRGGTRRISMQIAIDEAAFAAVLDSYILQSERPAKNATYSIDPTLSTPVSYSAEQTGISIDREQLTQRIRSAVLAGLSTDVEVPCTSVTPALTLSAIQAENALVAQYTTSFSGSTHSAPNRVFNMKKAAAAINGLVIIPGATFDCNAVLGDRTGENGWKLAPGIRNGRYEDEYGGGVCQISSTLFNAALMADLTITERHPHSWPMGYVEIGRDATISTGGKNFRFVNNSGAPLTLYMHVDEEEKTVTASIYGKPLEGDVHIDVVSEKTGTLEAAGETIMLDESLPANTKQVEREARDGKTSVTYKEYRTADGALVRRETAYEDTYRAIDGLAYVSTDLYYAQLPPETTPGEPEATPQQTPTADAAETPVPTPTPAPTPKPEGTTWEDIDDVPA